MKNKPKKQTDEEVMLRYESEHPITKSYTVTIHQRKGVNLLEIHAHGSMDNDKVISGLEAIINKLSN